MAAQVETRDNKTMQTDLTQNKQQNAPVASPKEWKEGGPSYLTSIQALLDNLTEEDKDTLHVSLQEE